MKSTLKNKLLTLLCVFIVEISVLSCQLSSQLTSPTESLPVPETNTPGNPVNSTPQNLIATQTEINPTVQATLTGTPVEAPTLAPIAGLTPTLVPSITATIPSQPVIANTYLVQTILPPAGGNKGGGPFSAMLVLPGQVWTGTMFGGLQQWDPQTGKVIKVLSNVMSKGFYDMKFDGKNLWVLTIDKLVGANPDTLYVISLPGGDIVKKFDLEKTRYLTQIGYSPGKVWVGSTIYDTDTLQPDPVSSGLPFEAHYAYDGEQRMWITGVHCEGCGHDLWLYDANNLPNHKDKENSGTSNDGVLDSPMVLAGGKMWLVVRPNGDPIYILDAYDIHKTDQPVLQINLTKEFKNTGSQSSQVYITTDNHVVWLSIVGKLYYFDLNTGQMLGSLSIGKQVMGMGFDGKSLWVLSNVDGLIQVSIPW